MTLLDAADRIAARLCRDALRFNGRCTWISAQIAAGDKLATMPLGPALYNGTAGIALFLHALADASGDSIFRETAAAAFAHAQDQAHKILRPWRPGFYSGWAGIGWALWQCGRNEEALQLLRGLPVTGELDLMCGSSGAIPALLRAGLKAQATLHGDALIEAMSDGAWPTLTRNARPARPHLTGFAHGAAGIAWSLHELHAATDEPRFRAAAEAGFAYEAGCFSPQHNAWPDYRIDPPGYPIAWCHGATGIGLARLGIPAYRNDVEIALAAARSTLVDVRAGNYSLCHGKSGNAEFCEARDAMEAAVAEFEEKRMPWPCGTKGAGEVPGLMLGAAGIGYTCLRFAVPGRYPSVLLP